MDDSFRPAAAMRGPMNDANSELRMLRIAP
jgi:hypothetical protein